MKLRRDRRGQSVVEYLLITGAVIVVVLGIRTLVSQQATTLFTSAGNQVGVAASDVDRLGSNLERP
jgi:Flp pilus assembly pilin Flp